jgi:NADPH:quinone reductase-like Zn-dependent oxidoreductase
MRAVRYTAYGSPDVLRLVEVPRPEPGPNQVLMRVHAGSVNPVDWKRASGDYRLVLPVRFPSVPMFDAAGVVEAVGPGVTGFAPGARVHARITGDSGGAAAEYALVGVDQLAHTPDSMSDAEAAAIPLAGMTALQALRDHGGLPLSGATQRVLVVGASGGVGHLALQIARAAGATVVGVCSARNAELVRSLGAHDVIDYAAPDPYAGQVAFDIVLDCVGADPGPFLPLTTATGRYVSCLPSPGNLLRTLLNPFSSRKVSAVMLSSNAADLAWLDALYASGGLRVVIDSRFPLARLSAAWQRSMSGRVVGKVIIDVTG